MFDVDDPTSDVMPKMSRPEGMGLRVGALYFRYYQPRELTVAAKGCLGLHTCLRQSIAPYPQM
jgi:hypothetical protein